MATDRFRITVSLSDRSVEDGRPIKRYPDVSEEERDRLAWAVSGAFCIKFDGDPLTIAPDGSPGCIDEYVWKQLVGLHSKTAELIAGNPVEQPILDNPGRTRFFPHNGQVDVIFQHPQEGKKSTTQATVPRKTILAALDRATTELIEELIEVNSELDGSYLIADLVDAHEDLGVLLERL